MGGKKEKGVGVVKNPNAPKMTLKQKKKAIIELVQQKKVVTKSLKSTDESKCFKDAW